MSADIASNDGNGNADRDLDAITDELAELRTKVEELNGLVEDYLVDVEQGLVQNARRIGSRLREAAEHDAQSVIEEIEENPITALSIAFALGALVGIVFLGRR
jgi:ElaB/YqjD/DUF883 family membrane-anchored ribosome-binding protein